MTVVVILMFMVLFQGATASSRWYQRNDGANLIAQYTFQEGQMSGVAPSVIRDRSEKNILGDLIASTTGVLTWGAMRQGMTIALDGGGPRSMSKRTTFDLLTCPSNGQLMFEVWFSTKRRTTAGVTAATIFGLGSWPVGSNNPLSTGSISGDWSCIDPPTPGGIQVFDVFDPRASSPVVLKTSLAASYGGSLRCIIPSAMPDSSDDTTSYSYVMLVKFDFNAGTWNDITQVRYDPVARTAVTVSTMQVRASLDMGPMYQFLPVWSPAPLTIGVQHSTTSWLGTIYAFSMYNKAFTDAENLARIRLGPPNSLPVGMVTSVTITEDVGGVIARGKVV